MLRVRDRRGQIIVWSFFAIIGRPGFLKIILARVFFVLGNNKERLFLF